MISVRWVFRRSCPICPGLEKYDILIRIKNKFSAKMLCVLSFFVLFIFFAIKCLLGAMSTTY